MAFVEIPETDAITSVIGAAIEVHRGLGPGLLESVYVACLARELEEAGLEFQRERLLPLFYKSKPLNLEYKLDLLVGGLVVVEVKSIERFAPVHRAQVLTYLRLTGCPTGLLLNFNVAVLKEGFQRVLNPHATKTLRASVPP